MKKNLWKWSFLPPASKIQQKRIFLLRLSFCPLSDSPFRLVDIFVTGWAYQRTPAKVINNFPRCTVSQACLFLWWSSFVSEARQNSCFLVKAVEIFKKREWRGGETCKCLFFKWRKRCEKRNAFQCNHFLFSFIIKVFLHYNLPPPAPFTSLLYIRLQSHKHNSYSNRITKIYLSSAA